MTIPTNPAVPNMPLATDEYERLYMDKLTNVLRLYFNQLNAMNATELSQISTNQVMGWLNTTL